MIVNAMFRVPLFPSTIDGLLTRTAGNDGTPSSFTIVTVADDAPIVTPGLAPERRTVNASSRSEATSPMIGIRIVACVVPAGIVTVPLDTVKSLPPTAVPLAVAYVTDTGDGIAWFSRRVSSACFDPEFPSVTR